MQPGFAVYTPTGGTVAQEFEHDGMHDVAVDFVAPLNGIAIVTVTGSGTVSASPVSIAAGVRLAPPSPNPVVRGGAAALSFSLPMRAASARLLVFDAAGRRVATLLDGPAEAGPHSARWDASGVPSGVYLVSLDALGARRTVKLAVVR
jgi:hypothetical protein